jgi:hypothetical protein
MDVEDLAGITKAELAKLKKRKKKKPARKRKKCAS